jgi:hypothetical protein
MEERTDTEEIVPGLPLDDFRHLTVARVLPRLQDLTPEQLRRLQDYERTHGNRQPVLAAITRALAA